MTLTYATSRRVLAISYWRSLRRNPRHLIAWLVWLAIGFGAGALLVPAEGARDWSSVAAGAVSSLLTAASLFLYPQLQFKPQTRTLTLLRDGISTSIAGIAKSYTWADVLRIDVDGDFVVVTFRNLNGFIIPPSAFTSAGEREGAVVQFRTWLTEAGSASAA